MNLKKVFIKFFSKLVGVFAHNEVPYVRVYNAVEPAIVGSGAVVVGIDTASDDHSCVVIGQVKDGKIYVINETHNVDEPVIKWIEKKKNSLWQS